MTGRAMSAGRFSQTAFPFRKSCQRLYASLPERSFFPMPPAGPTAAYTQERRSLILTPKAEYLRKSIPMRSIPCFPRISA